MKCPYCGEEIRFIEYTDFGVKECVGGVWRNTGDGEFRASCTNCYEELTVDDLLEMGIFDQEIHIMDVARHLNALLKYDQAFISKLLNSPVECNQRIREILGKERPTMLDIINDMFNCNLEIIAELDDQHQVRSFMIRSKE